MEGGREGGEGGEGGEEGREEGREGGREARREGETSTATALMSGYARPCGLKDIMGGSVRAACWLLIYLRQPTSACVASLQAEWRENSDF